MGSRPHLSLFKFPTLTRTYVCCSRQSFTKVLSMTPRSAIDNVDATGCTALSWAVQCCDRDCVEQLLLRGSDPGIVDLSGRNPLHYAVSSGVIAITQLLVAANADVNSRNIDGITVLHMAADVEEGTPIIDLLLSRGASLDSEDNEGFRALHHAVYINNPENLQLLLDRGANINAVHVLGTTALMCGILANAHETLRLLLRDETLDYNAKNSNGRTVLDLIALHGDLVTLRILRSSGKMKSINLRDSEALDLAVWRRENNEAHSVWVSRPFDKDPLLWYSAFEALWNSILEAQQHDLEGNPAFNNRVIGGELTDDDEDAEVWEDAREAVDRSPA